MYLAIFQPNAPTGKLCFGGSDIALISMASFQISRHATSIGTNSVKLDE